MKKLSFTLLLCLFLSTTGSKHSFAGFFINDDSEVKESSKPLSRAERRKNHRIPTSTEKNPEDSFSLFPDAGSKPVAKSEPKPEPAQITEPAARPVNQTDSSPRPVHQNPAVPANQTFTQTAPKPNNDLIKDTIFTSKSSPKKHRITKPKVPKGKVARKKWDYKPGTYAHQSRSKSPKQIRAFDISNVKLGMTLDMALTMAKKKGFTQTKFNNEIPKFIDWKFEKDCKSSGLSTLKSINACKMRQAKSQGVYYTSKIDLKNPSTRETMEFFLTSKYTDNKVYKIKYHTFQDKSAGISKKSLYQLQDNNRNFWIRVIKKYGSPDNHEFQTWGRGAGQPYLRAETGHLILEDPRMAYMDSRKMMLVDKGMEDYSMYSF